MQPVQILVTLEGGKLKYESNTPDKILLLGLLEMTKSLVIKEATKPTPTIEAPSPSLTQLLAPAR